MDLRSSQQANGLITGPRLSELMWISLDISTQSAESLLNIANKVLEIEQPPFTKVRLRYLQVFTISLKVREGIRLTNGVRVD